MFARSFRKVALAMVAGVALYVAPGVVMVHAGIDGISFSPDAPEGMARLLFPRGRPKAVTLSFDDAVTQDRRFVRILNAYGLKCTFHVPSQGLTGEWNINSNEVASLYAGHEVAVHDGNTKCETNEYRQQVVEARERLVAMVGYPVRGLAYVGGDYTEQAVATLPSAGIEYARGIGGDEGFGIRTNFLAWNTTAHWGRGAELVDGFLAVEKGPAVFSIWGHSYEFDENDGANWQGIETLCRKLAGRTNLWYATCIQLVDYVRAAQALTLADDGSVVVNPGQIPVWLDVGGKVLCAMPGASTPLDRAGVEAGVVWPADDVVPAVQSPPEWTAFNDSAWNSTQPSEGITCYGPAELRSGPLVDSSTGGRLPVIVQFSGASGYIDVAAQSGAKPDSDAAKVFGAKLGLDGYVRWEKGEVTMTVSGLDPSNRYEVVLYGSRGSSAEMYRSRLTSVSISGVQGYQNGSSKEAVIIATKRKGDTARLTAADVGAVWRFRSIRPGLDGRLVLTLAATDGGGYLNAFMIRTFDSGAARQDTRRAGAGR